MSTRVLPTAGAVAVFAGGAPDSGFRAALGLDLGFFALPDIAARSRLLTNLFVYHARYDRAAAIAAGTRAGANVEQRADDAGAVLHDVQSHPTGAPSAVWRDARAVIADRQ